MKSQLLKTVWNERRSNIALFLELFLISLFLWYVIDTIYAPIKTYLKPLGYSVENVYIVSLSSVPEKSPHYNPDLTSEEQVEDYYTMIERIRKHPDVAEVGLSWHGRPESRNWWSMGIWADTLGLKNVKWRALSPEAARLYQLEEVQGDDEKLVSALEAGRMIISASLAEEIGPNAIGISIYNNSADDSDRSLIGVVGAIAKDMRDTRFTNHVPFMITPLTKDNNIALEINVKAKEGREQGFAERLSTDLKEQLQLGNMQLENVRSFQEESVYSGRMFERQLLLNGLLVLFLLANIILGISGVFWYRTQKRKSQMGLRVALGDTPRGVLRLYYKEGLLIFSSAFVLSIAVFVALFKYDILNTELEPLDATRFVIGMVITYLVTAAVIILSIWLPARHILRTPPADTLKEE